SPTPSRMPSPVEGNSVSPTYCVQNVLARSPSVTSRWTAPSRASAGSNWGAGTGGVKGRFDLVSKRVHFLYVEANCQSLFAGLIHLAWIGSVFLRYALGNGIAVVFFDDRLAAKLDCAIWGGGIDEERGQRRISLQILHLLARRVQRQLERVILPNEPGRRDLRRSVRVNGRQCDDLGGFENVAV